MSIFQWNGGPWGMLRDSSCNRKLNIPTRTVLLVRLNMNYTNIKSCGTEGEAAEESRVDIQRRGPWDFRMRVLNASWLVKTSYFAKINTIIKTPQVAGFDFKNTLLLIFPHICSEISYDITVDIRKIHFRRAVCLLVFHLSSSHKTHQSPWNIAAL